MRRFFKPVFVTVGAAAAAFLIASGAAPFNGAPAAKSVKATTFCSQPPTITNSENFLPDLPTLPSIPRPEFSIPCIPLPELPPLEAPRMPKLPRPEHPEIKLPPIVIPPIPVIGFPGYPTTTWGCSTEAQSALLSCP